MNTLRPLLACLFALILALSTTVGLQAADPQQETALLIEIQTPIVANGKQVGMMKLPAGSKVTVVSELPDGFLVTRSGGAPFKVAKAAIAAPSSSSAVVVTPAIAATPAAATRATPQLPPSTSKVPILATTGVEAGLCVKMGSSTLEELRSLTNDGRMLVEALLPDRASADALREQVAKAGLLGLITVKQQYPGPLPYVATSVNLLIADLDAPGAPPAAEIARVVAPFGATYFCQKGTWTATRIPLPATMDEWGQANKGPGQNAWSADQLAGPITGLRWFAPHSFFNSGKVPMRMVGGRTFTVDMDETGRQNRMQIEGRDAMNGTLLWTAPTEFPLGSNADSHREYFVANAQHLYTYPQRTGPLTCFDARTGAVVRQFTDGPLPVPIKGSPTADRDNWLQLLGAQVVLTDKYVISILSNSLRVYDDATGALVWNKVFPDVVRMRASVDHGRLYLVVQDTSLDIGQHPGTRTGFSSMTAYDLVTGKDLWKSDLVINPGQAFIYLPPTVVGDQLVLAIKYYKLEGAKSAGGNAGDLSAGWLFAGVDAATGKTRWKESTKDCGGNIDATIWWVCGHWVNADGILWIGYVNRATGIDTKNGKLVKNQEIKGWNCHWSRGAGKWYTASQNFLNTDTLGMSLGNAVRTGCNDGLFFAYGADYIWSQSCPCGLFLIGKAATIFSDPPKPIDDAQRLEVFTPVALTPEVPPAQRWSAYMGNSERSGMTASTFPAAPKQAWKTSITGTVLKTGLAADWASDSILRPLTAPVVEGHTLVVARPQIHTVVGLDAESGAVKWTTVLGGRIDSSPTLYRGHAYVGCRDGYVYCLGLDDGKIRWRYLVATNREQMGFASQLESKWPVLGTTLIHDGALYACAGRHSQFDGGLTVAKLDPVTGKQVWRSTVSSIRNYFNSILNEPLLVNGGRIWMSKTSLDPKDGKVVDEVAQRLNEKAAITFQEPPVAGERLPSDNIPSNTGDNRMSGRLGGNGIGFPGMVGLNQSILVPGTFVQVRGGSCLNLIFDQQGTILAGLHGFSSKGSGTTPWGLRNFPSDVLASDHTKPSWINKTDASAMVANSTQVAVVNLANKGAGNVGYTGARPSTWSVFNRADGTPVGEPLKLPATVSWRGAAAADGKLWFSFEDGSVGCWK